MIDFSSNIILVIAVTSIATYLSRSLGVLFSERIDENSKIFRLFDCIAYSTLAALISKVVVFPAGDLGCLLYTSPSPRDKRQSRMPSSA